MARTPLDSSFQKQTFELAPVMSALPLRADMLRVGIDVG